ncbi:MAG: alpha-amylase family glycosyl hydrolase [Anaerolineaceae bacterium]|nr:alpha-amylase family glycosyl hydrolase [Anaerolineaceae bacterium]
MNNTPDWIQSAFIYHLYPLGLTAAPHDNHYEAPTEYRLDKLYAWLDHLQWLGVNTLFLGPILQSSQHGYDTIDYFQVDKRLGDNHSFKAFSQEVHRRGMRLILDAVFNHSGRDFWAFQDLQQKGQQSTYKDWYEGVRFDQASPVGDAFNYETWAGYHSLPKFNLANPAVREHLFQAVRFWINEWGIDGLRLDAADHVRLDFWQELRQITTSLQPDFWLMGEVVHGEYQQWANSEHLHSVTNYEAYKGLYSSLNDANFFEIAHTLHRQFGEGGLYRDLMLYNFVDNHDVNRVASQLKFKGHLYPLYALLFTMPGIPSLYYGSEWGLEGKRSEYSDQALRPALNLETLIHNAPIANLPDTIRQLSEIRFGNSALQIGSYRQAFISPTQFAFWRETEDQKVLVAINAAFESVSISGIQIPDYQTVRQIPGNDFAFKINNNEIVMQIPPQWFSILIFE